MSQRARPVLTLVLLLGACGGGGDGDGEGQASDPTMSAGTDDPTGGAASEAVEVCAAACAKFAACLGDNPDCEGDCVASVEFLAMNNPGTQCGSYEVGRQDCLSSLTCEELDAHLHGTDDATRPCNKWIDEEKACAVE